MNDRESIENRIRQLESELRHLRSQLIEEAKETRTVIVPSEVEDVFATVEKKVASYFSDFQFDPESGEITAFGERYVLFRAGSVSLEYLRFVQERYSDYPPHEAVSIGNNFLYDNAKVTGKKDAIAFHDRLKLKDPIEKLSAGPVHFAFTGWANVEIFPESRPVADRDFKLVFRHHNSFEAQSWIKAGAKSDIPVCTMNCGYSAGWCEESFGISLTTVEVTCEAKGDPACTFIMAPSDKIEKYVEETVDLEAVKNFEIPVFFKRKYTEEKLKESIQQKELLIKEIHHRVKNNLQVITSLLRLQMDNISNDNLKEEFQTSINRITTMAAVHELMYKGQEFDKVSLESYFIDLANSLVSLYTLDDSVNVNIRVNIADHLLDLEKSIPLALVMNEITCNAYKHALQSGGEFNVSLSDEDDHLLLVMKDNGPGYDAVEFKEGLGISLIEILCNQLNADLIVSNTADGLEYKIRFNLAD